MSFSPFLLLLLPNKQASGSNPEQDKQEKQVPEAAQGTGGHLPCPAFNSAKGEEAGAQAGRGHRTEPGLQAFALQ
jgi:hypothetical protein